MRVAPRSRRGARLRVLHLRRRFYASKAIFAPAGSREERAIVRALRELADPRLELPRHGDRSMDLPPSVLGRPVKGTDLTLCYLPAGEDVFVIALVRGER